MIRNKSMSAGRRSARSQLRPRSNFRARVTAAFVKMANGVDPRTACDRTHDFYRSSGADWTQNFRSIASQEATGFRGPPASLPPT